MRFQTVTNLPSTNWSAASPLPVVVGTTNIVTNSIAGSDRFYRFSSP